MIKMIEGGYVTFPENYDGKGYLSLLDVDQKVLSATRKKLEDKYSKMELSVEEFEEKVAEEMEKLDIGKIKMYKLSPDEEAALGQIDLLKEEVVNAVRVKRESGKDQFKISPEKSADTGGYTARRPPLYSGYDLLVFKSEACGTHSEEEGYADE